MESRAVALEELGKELATYNKDGLTIELLTTKFLAVAQKAVMEAHALLEKENQSQNEAAVQKHINEAKSLLTSIYILAKEILTDKESQIDKTTGYSLFWFAVQCLQERTECEKVLTLYLKDKKASKENLRHVDNVGWLSDLFCMQYKPFPNNTNAKHLMFAAIDLSNTEVMRLMIELIPSVAFSPDENGFSPTAYSAMSGKLIALQFFHQLENMQELDKNVRDAKQITEPTHARALTTLMLAAICRHHAVIDWLCVNAPDLLNRQNSTGATALVNSIEVNDEDEQAVGILLNHHADITIATGDNHTYPKENPLSIAFLLKKPSIINKFAESYSGYTLLHRAIAENDIITLKLLLKYNGSFPNNVDLLTTKTGEVTNDPGLTPVQLACKLNQSEALYAMLAHCLEKCEKLDEAQPKATALEILKRNFALLDKMLGLMDNITKDMALFSQSLDKPLVGLLTKILPYFRLRNNGKQFHNHVSQDNTVLHFASETAKTADRTIKEYIGISISSTFFAGARACLNKISELEPYLGSNVQVLESYEEFDKLLVAWKLIENIISKRDLLFGLDDREKRILQDGRLGEMTSDLIPPDTQMEQRSPLRASK